MTTTSQKERQRHYRAENRERINAARREATARRRAAGEPAPVHVITARYPASSGRKVCQRCGVERSKAEFNNNIRYSDGLCPYCGTCKRERYARNRAQVCAQARTWHAENRDRVKARKRRYYAEHRDEINARRRRPPRPPVEPKEPGPSSPTYPATDGRKRCKTCLVEQPVEEFHNNKAYLDLRCPYCKTCKREKQRQYRPRQIELAHKHRERNRDYARSYRAANRETINARRRELRAADQRRTG